MNLTNIPDMIEIVAKWAREPKMYVLTGDFRHFFHRITMGEMMTRFFGVHCEGVSWCWKTLPMGWSWSPTIAQAIGWTTIAGRVKNQSPLYDERELRDEFLPSQLNVVDKDGTVIGIALLYYDNFLIICNDAVYMQRIKAQFDRNCQKFSVVLKEKTSLGHTDLRSGKLAYLGCQFQRGQNAYVMDLTLTPWNGG